MSCPENKHRSLLKNKKRIVIKVGTSSITYDNGKINLRFIDHLARQISDLKNSGLQVILVTSGAIGVGLPELGFEKNQITCHITGRRSCRPGNTYEYL